jgi:hypothetical protein
LSDCPVPVKTNIEQVDLVLRLSDGTSEKIRDSQTCRYDGQIYFHWYKILGLLYKRALFDLQFVHNLFWVKLKWNARSKLFYWDKFKFGAKLIFDNVYVSVPGWFLLLYFKYWYFRSLKHFWDCDFNFVNVLELHQRMEER